MGRKVDADRNRETKRLLFTNARTHERTNEATKKAPPAHANEPCACLAALFKTNPSYEGHDATGEWSAWPGTRHMSMTCRGARVVQFCGCYPCCTAGTAPLVLLSIFGLPRRQRAEWAAPSNSFFPRCWDKEKLPWRPPASAGSSAPGASAATLTLRWSVSTRLSALTRCGTFPPIFESCEFGAAPTCCRCLPQWAARPVAPRMSSLMRRAADFNTPTLTGARLCACCRHSGQRIFPVHRPMQQLHTTQDSFPRKK